MGHAAQTSFRTDFVGQLLSLEQISKLKKYICHLQLSKFQTQIIFPKKVGYETWNLSFGSALQPLFIYWEKKYESILNTKFFTVCRNLEETETCLHFTVCQGCPTQFR